LARGVQATTAIEGNTLTETEVKQIVAEGTAPRRQSPERPGASYFAKYLAVQGSSRTGWVSHVA
jgi:hypothetical protein